MRSQPWSKIRSLSKTVETDSGARAIIGVSTLCCICFLVGVALGHFTVPVQVLEEKAEKRHELDVEALGEQSASSSDTHLRTLITEREYPSGLKEKITEKVLEKTHANEVSLNTKKTDSVDLSLSETKIVKKELGLNIGLLIGPDPSNLLNICYGGQMNKAVLGPFTLGMWATTCRNLGVQIGVQF